MRIGRTVATEMAFPTTNETDRKGYSRSDLLFGAFMQSVLVRSAIVTYLLDRNRQPPSAAAFWAFRENVAPLATPQTH